MAAKRPSTQKREHCCFIRTNGNELGKKKENGLKQLAKLSSPPSFLGMEVKNGRLPARRLVSNSLVKR